MLTNEAVSSILGKMFNAIYSIYLKTNDLEILSVLNSMINTIALADLSFTEYGVGDNVTGLRTFIKEVPEYPENSYFLKLGNILMTERIKMTENSTYCKPKIDTVTPSSPNEKKKKSDKVKIEVPVPNMLPEVEEKLTSDQATIISNSKARLSMVRCSNYSEVSESRLNEIPKDIRDIYEECGFKEFLKGTEVIHGGLKTIGVVIGFSINASNTLTFLVNTGKDRGTQWSIHTCLIKRPGSNKCMSIIDYIKMLSSDRKKNEVVYDEEQKRFHRSILCDSFDKIPTKRLEGTDKEVLSLYEKCGFKNFLKGMTITNGKKSAIVTAFFISRHNKLSFTVAKLDVASPTEWSMYKCVIKRPGESTYISILDYIAMGYPKEIHTESTVSTQLSMF